MEPYMPAKFQPDTIILTPLSKVAMTQRAINSDRSDSFEPFWETKLISCAKMFIQSSFSCSSGITDNADLIYSLKKF